MGNVLAIPALNELVRFSYLPVSHTNPNGTYACSVEDNGTVYDLDCPGTYYETCLAREVCWYGACSAETQERLASFLQCYEGPGANSEAELDPSTRPACLKAAFGSVKAEVLGRAVQACSADDAVLEPLLDTLNASKSTMVASTPYTVFPVIYVGGAFQPNASWTALTRTICDLSAAKQGDLSTSPAKDCLPTPIALTVIFDDGGGVTGDGGGSGSHGGGSSGGNGGSDEVIADAVAHAVDLAAGNASLPVRFATDDDELTPAGAVSYVDVRAVVDFEVVDAPTTGGRVRPPEVEPADTSSTATYHATLLRTFAGETVAFVNSDTDTFVGFVNDALAAIGVGDLTATSAAARVL